MSFISIDSASLSTQEAYKLICGAVVPRPIAWISSVNKGGLVNIAPFSSFNYVAHSPPMLAVNIGSREGGLKDTASNIIKTKEFVVNVATIDTMNSMHQTSAEYPPNVSEASELGIELIASTHIKVPRIKSSPIHMECRLVKKLNLGIGLNTLYIGEVLAFHIESSLYDGNYIDSVKLRPIARLGGPFYAELGKIHTLQALQQPPK